MYTIYLILITIATYLTTITSTKLKSTANESLGIKFLYSFILLLSYTYLIDLPRIPSLVLAFIGPIALIAMEANLTTLFVRLKLTKLTSELNTLVLIQNYVFVSAILLVAEKWALI